MMASLRFLLLAFAATLTAHEIPSDVTVYLHLTRSANTLHIAARVPLAAMRDVDFPLIDSKYLNVEQFTPQLPTIATTWVANSIHIPDAPRPKVIATKLSLISDPPFTTFNNNTRTTLTANDHLIWQQLWLDIGMDLPYSSPSATLPIRPGLERLGLKVLTVIHYSGQVYELHGDPGLVHLNPSPWSASQRFITLGFEHILTGTDHLLFLFCLVLPTRKLKPLLIAITAFTLGHSLTLISAALGLAPTSLQFPALIESAIAASILWMAIENIAEIQTRWPLVAAFGLIHGFGFSFALRENLQLAGNHLLTSLLAFNLGVELGQLLAITILWLILNQLKPTRLWIIILSTLIGHTAWHWLITRATPFLPEW
jgi:hypothetical protein